MEPILRRSTHLAPAHPFASALELEASAHCSWQRVKLERQPPSQPEAREFRGEAARHRARCARTPRHPPQAAAEAGRRRWREGEGGAHARSGPPARAKKLPRLALPVLLFSAHTDGIFLVSSSLLSLRVLNSDAPSLFLSGPSSSLSTHPPNPSLLLDSLSFSLYLPPHPPHLS